MVRMFRALAKRLAGRESERAERSSTSTRQVQTVRIVVASPNDVQAEREALPAVMEELNRGVAAVHGLRLELSRWETDAYPGFHPEGPQGLIDPILKIEDCDVLIGVFWKRFGTPVKDAQSGTEHEFRLAYTAWGERRRPQIMLYFRNADEPETEEEKKQWSLVQDFRRNLPPAVLPWSYDEQSQFEKLARLHLTNFIRDQFPIPHGKSSHRSPKELTKLYLEQLADKVGKVYILGEGEPRELEKVFVELSIIEDQQPSLINTAYLGLMDAEMRRRRALFARQDENAETTELKAGDDKIRRMLKPDELLRGRTQTVITGAPGCGKTTLLRYLAWKTLKEEKRLPVFLELKTVTEEAFKQSHNDLSELLFDRAIVGSLYLEAAERERFKQSFFARLAAGEALICLDGLDEVRGADFFPALWNSVREFARSTYRNNALIISTRPYALRARFEGLKETEISLLSQRQVEEFLKHYYGNDPATKEFLQALGKRRELRELVRVPFLLSVIAQLHRSQHELVGNRLELYRQIVLHLAVRLDSEKSLTHSHFHITDPDGSLKLDFLKQLAFERLLVDDTTMEGSEQEAARLVFTGEVLLEKARQFLEQEKRPEINSRLLAADAKATPLLREVGTDVYAFSHLTIQEYLAAVALSRREDCEKLFCCAYFNPSLAEMEVLPMALGLAHKPEILYAALEQLPESLTFANLRLRARGLAYGSKISQPNVARLTARLIEFINQRHAEDYPYHDAVVRSFSATGDAFSGFITDQVASLLQSPDWKIGGRAVDALGQIGGERAIAPLIEALKNERGQVDEKAAAALGRIGGERVETVLIDTLKATIKRLSGRLNYETVAALKRIGGEPTLATSLELIKDTDGETRAVGIEILGKLGGERAEASLLDALKDSYVSVRSAALRAMEQFGGERTVKALIEMLGDRDTSLRYDAAQILGRIGGEETITALIEALKSQDFRVRMNAAVALGLIGGERAVEAVAKALLSDVSFDVRIRAAQALERMGGEKALKALIASFAASSRDPDLHSRPFVVRALGQIGGEQVVPLLIEALKDSWIGTRRHAAEALRHVGAKQAVEPLIEALKDEEHSIRVTIAEALGQIGGERAEAVLIEALKDEETYIGAARGLGQLGGERAEAALVEVLKDKESRARWSAIEALGQIGGERAEAALIKVYEEGYWHKEATEALGQIGGEPSVATLIECLSHESLDVRVRAAEALEKFSHAKLASVLAQVISPKENGSLSSFVRSHGFLRRKAAQVVGYYTRDVQVLDELSRLAAIDPDDEVREAALEAQDKFECKLRHFA